MAESLVALALMARQIFFTTGAAAWLTEAGVVPSTNVGADWLRLVGGVWMADLLAGWASSGPAMALSKEVVGLV